MVEDKRLGGVACEVVVPGCRTKGIELRNHHRAPLVHGCGQRVGFVQMFLSISPPRPLGAAPLPTVPPSQMVYGGETKLMSELSPLPPLFFMSSLARAAELQLLSSPFLLLAVLGISFGEDRNFPFL
ncbi:hypothetical protein TanjilG_12815 [Lupinus angustifolius]|uniref:Uncharacterized protein n=1 Tax=Lupinus angustifolius TaxID=3871 RepID=A0A1J7H308_LUPAN|nr:hypothetical protein TanjilG_12815 [Lupinus angustifolius]